MKKTPIHLKGEHSNRVLKTIDIPKPQNITDLCLYLGYGKFTKRFEVYSDKSLNGLRVILAQTQERRESIIAYASWTLRESKVSKKNRKYTASHWHWDQQADRALKSWHESIIKKDILVLDIWLEKAILQQSRSDNSVIDLPGVQDLQTIKSARTTGPDLPYPKQLSFTNGVDGLPLGRRYCTEIQESAAKSLWRDLILLYGCPAQLHSDEGDCFEVRLCAHHVFCIGHVFIGENESNYVSV